MNKLSLSLTSFGRSFGDLGQKSRDYNVLKNLLVNPSGDSFSRSVDEQVQISARSKTFGPFFWRISE